MSLPLLVNSANCGPTNPLQGLSKRFDQDRGIQQDQFGAGRAGSSKETFRSQYSAATGVNKDASKFFSSPAPLLPAPSPFDLSTPHRNLPVTHSEPPVHVQSSAQSPLQPGPAAWAADFLSQQPGSAMSSLPSQRVQPQSASLFYDQNMTPPSNPTSWMSMSAMPRSPSVGIGATQFSPIPGIMIMGSHTQSPIQMDAASKWDNEFQTQELSLNSAAAAPIFSAEADSISEGSSRVHHHDADELARTAGVLIDTVQDEQNLKFKKSAFMGLMRQLRDGEVVVEGNDMVQRSDAGPVQSSADAKGKGRAGDFSGPPEVMKLRTLQRPITAIPFTATTNTNTTRQTSEGVGATREDPNDAYFRQENEEYITMQAGIADTRQTPSFQFQHQQAEWDTLQRDWEAFETTAHGLQRLDKYQFQSNNPYVNGEASRTKLKLNAVHADMTLYESPLELEAAVQRDITNATRWFELGVNQQENEREHKAIQALRRALELDPTQLATWLALAISHTNEGDRMGAYNAIREWVDRNERYTAAVTHFRSLNPEEFNATANEKLTHLMQCLMSIVRENAGEEIDADLQIALAVLLNTNEEYAKARDCFTTALAVRPNDWALYNRVGATLANSGHPEEALQYYYIALDLNPGYIRARFNLGVSCTNLRRYDEAAQHILDALSLQDSDSVRDPNGNPEDNRGVTSHLLWDNLKTCCLHMQRLDLATLCDQRNLEAFRLNFQMM